MISYLETIRRDLQSRLLASIVAADFGITKVSASENLRELVVGQGVTVEVRVVPWRQRGARGMFTTNIVALLVRACGGNRQGTAIAQEILAHLSLDGTFIERVVFAEPGFLNFYLQNGWQQEALKSILNSPTIMHNNGFDRLEVLNRDFEISYAYRRMCNQLELLAQLGYRMPCVADTRLELLESREELGLIEHLADAPEQNRAKAQQYLTELAKLFHQFFNISPIRGEAGEIAGARIALLQACKQVFAYVLKESFSNT